MDLKINFPTSSPKKRGPCYSQVWPPTTAPPREPGTHTYQGEANKAALFFQITQIHTQASPTRLPKLSSLSSKCIGCTELSPNNVLATPNQRIPSVSLSTCIDWKTIFKFLSQHFWMGIENLCALTSKGIYFLLDTRRLILQFEIASVQKSI